jgi:lambda family phage minor tail protein L
MAWDIGAAQQGGWDIGAAQSAPAGGSPLNLALSPASVTLTAAAPARSGALGLALDPAAVSLTAAAPDRSGALGLALDPAAVTLIAAAPSRSGALNFALDPASVSLTAVGPDSALAFGLTLDPAAVTLTAPGPTRSGALGFALDPASVTLTAASPARSGALGLALDPAGITLAAVGPDSALIVGLTLDPASVTLTAAAIARSGALALSLDPAIVALVAASPTLAEPPSSIVASYAAGSPTGFPSNLQPRRSAIEGDRAWVWLFEVEVPTSPATRYRVTSHTTSIIFGSNSAGEDIEYFPFPMQVGTMDQNKDGDLPEIQVAVSNVTREIGAAIETYDGLQGQPVVIRLVNMAHLVDFNDQIPTNARVRSAKVTGDVVAFTLSPYNLMQERVPRYRFLRDHCPYLFGGDRCGYVIPATPGETVGTGFSTCPKTRPACEERGDDEVARALARLHPERFGGWIGLPRLSQKATF